MHKLLLMLGFTAILLAPTCIRPVEAQERLNDTSLRAPKEPVIRQTSPATCGPAALATLFTFHFNDPVSEKQMIDLVGMQGKTSSTIAELRDASIKKGYSAKGLKMTLPELLNAIQILGNPVVAHFTEPTLHFVLVLGRVDDFILVSDPDAGQISLDTSDFLRRWDGKALVITSERPSNTTLMSIRKRSADTRIKTLRHANAMTSIRRF